MAKKKRKDEIPEVILTPEEKLEKARLLADRAAKLDDFGWKLFFIRRSIALMNEIKEIMPETIPELQTYRRTRSEYQVDQRVFYHTKARELMANAGSIADYEKAMEYWQELKKLESKPPVNPSLITEASQQRLADIPAADEGLKECQAAVKKLQKKDNARVRNRIGIFAAILVCLFLFSQTAPARHLLGMAAEAAGKYDIARKAYHSAYVRGGDEDDEALSVKCNYVYADSLYESGAYEHAQNIFRKLSNDNYEDSLDRMIDCEKKMLEKAAVGTKVNFAEESWLVLDKDDESILLYRVHALAGKNLAHTDSDTTWETSCMRAYLNDTYINGAFLPEEAALILPQTIHTEDNGTYQTAGGNDTTDRIFLLSVDELEQYKDIMYTTKTGFYLRTPGANPGSFAYASTNLDVMDYGYEQGSDLLRLKPVMRVSYAD